MRTNYCLGHFKDCCLGADPESLCGSVCRVVMDAMGGPEIYFPVRF